MTGSTRRFAIGVDFGTNSVRALIIDVADGSEVASHVCKYSSGEDGVLLDPKDPNLARQDPAEYIKGFYASVRRAVAAAKRKRGFRVERVVGIGAVDGDQDVVLDLVLLQEPQAADDLVKGRPAALV